jgi:DnaJ-class molecular chaperone
MKKSIIVIFLFYFFLFICSASSQNQKCLICHAKPDFSILKEDGQKKYLYVDISELEKSIHKDKRCQDCHVDIVEISATGHKKNVQPVNCTRCHFEGNPVGAPQTTKYFQYQLSVHGQASASGDLKAPKCQDCHGIHGIQSHKSNLSKVYKFNIAKVCGKCHLKEYTEFATSVHGKALEKENVSDVPTCTDCHGEHDIKKISDSSSTVFKTKLSNTCSKCHSSTLIMQKYGIRTEQVNTYKESYHGIATEFGEKKAANCASCHGVHDIKPENDPVSYIYPANIPKTCGKCHPDANANYAKGKIHLNSKSPDSGPIYYINIFFKYLTIFTLCALFLHIVLDLSRKIRGRKKMQRKDF